MKKLIANEFLSQAPAKKKVSAGKPPKGLAVPRKPLNPADIDVALHAEMTKKLTFKETTQEDFKRIQAELKNELGKV